jgi:hypothetical protein
MDPVRAEQNAGPEVAVRQMSAERSEPAGFWKIGWVVRNRALQPLRILGIRVPHGQFKADPSVFEPGIDLQAGSEKEFYTLVRCDGPPGLVTENAFLIFHVTWDAQPWRIFARVRVVAGADGMPEATTESITTQAVGFSQEDL